MTTPAPERPGLTRAAVLAFALVIGLAQVAYLVALRDQLRGGPDEGWAFATFVGAIVLAIGAWSLLVVRALASSAPRAPDVPATAALVLALVALGLLVALLVLRLALSVGGDLVALGVLAEGTASVVLVYVALIVRSRGVVVSA